jgi:hypothetical protein
MLVPYVCPENAGEEQMAVQVCESYGAITAKCKSNQSMTYSSGGDIISVYAQDNVVKYSINII